MIATAKVVRLLKYRNWKAFLVGPKGDHVRLAAIRIADAPENLDAHPLPVFRCSRRRKQLAILAKRLQLELELVSADWFPHTEPSFGLVQIPIIDPSESTLESSFCDIHGMPNRPIIKAASVRLTHGHLGTVASPTFEHSSYGSLVGGMVFDRQVPSIPYATFVEIGAGLRGCSRGFRS